VLAKLSSISPSKLPLVDGEPRLGVPIAAAGKFIAIGLNYADHAAEANLPLPSKPIVFQKAKSTTGAGHACLRGAALDPMRNVVSLTGTWTALPTTGDRHRDRSAR